jgi:hypothetical protein
MSAAIPTRIFVFHIAALKIKGKACTGPGGFRRLKLPDFKTIGA